MPIIALGIFVGWGGGYTWVYDGGLIQLKVGGGQEGSSVQGAVQGLGGGVVRLGCRGLRF